MATEAIKAKAREDLTNAFFASDKTYQEAGFGSQAVTAGFIGQIDKIEMTKIEGPGISKRNAAQTVNGVVIADANDASYTMSIVFVGGARTLSINTLVQSTESFITMADGTAVPFIKMRGDKEWKELRDSKAIIECVDVSDTDKTRRRVKRGGDLNETEEVKIRKYEFKVNAPAA